MSAKMVFQSTLPHGSDLGMFDLADVLLISIHAPSRERLDVVYTISLDTYFNPRSLTGATPRRCQSWLWRYHFNPRSLTGATTSGTFIPTLDLFQSTLPHGSDSSHTGKQRTVHDFNPRSLTGATIKKYLVFKNAMLFQSTLPHGSDLI